MRILAFFLVLCLAGAWATPLVQKRNTPYEWVSIITMEEACVRQGGLCMRIEDCPEGSRTELGRLLCPLQQDSGVECCYADR